MTFAATTSWGLSIGGNLLLQNYIWAEYYGRGNLGGRLRLRPADAGCRSRIPAPATLHLPTWWET
jgi:hypothetical protein